jgi:hypothetical protein
MGAATILFVAANPSGTERVLLDQEYSLLDKQLRMSARRDELALHAIWAASPLDLVRTLNDTKPAVVHFAGHGTRADGLLLVNEASEVVAISGTALRKLLVEFPPTIKLVVLNACCSDEVAGEIVDVVGCVIGMTEPIYDEPARRFSEALYIALYAGRSVTTAFNQALALYDPQRRSGRTRDVEQVASSRDVQVPVLRTRAGVDASEIVLLPPRPRGFRRAVTAAAVALALLILGVVGAWAYARWSSAAELRRALAELETRRTSMSSNDAPRRIYAKYHRARRMQGALFWSDPDLAGRGTPNGIGTSDVRDHNLLLRSALGARQLRVDPTGSMPALRRYFGAVDEALAEAKAATGEGIYDQMSMNDKLCRYWELVLCEREEQTYLTQSLVDCRAVHQLSVEVPK